MDAPPRGARPRAWPGPASPLSSAASPGPLLPAGLRLPSACEAPSCEAGHRPAAGSGSAETLGRASPRGPESKPGALRSPSRHRANQDTSAQSPSCLKSESGQPEGAGLSPWKGPAPGGWEAAGVTTGRRPAWVCALQNGPRRVTGGCAGARWGEGARGLLSGPRRSRPRCPDRHHVRSGEAWRSLSRVGNTSRSGRAALGRARALSSENAGTSHDLGGRGAEPSRFTGREQAPRLNTAGRDSQRLCHL